MADGFLGRWSRRKLGQEEEGMPPAEAAVPPPPPQPALVEAGDESALLPAAPGEVGNAVAEPAEPPPPPPTLEDVQLLTADSDFRRFVARDVAPDVKNAAMKKLFTDPHYNVMDMLDVYVDDYSQPDPIPESMLRQLASAKFLGLFADEEKKASATREVADDPSAESVAQLSPASPAVTQVPPDADTDLRLQQDDAAAGEEPGRGTE